MQNIVQDIQYGLYDSCGDPNTNWDLWKNRCIELLKERKILGSKSKTYTWQEVCDITNNAGGRTYCAPFGSYDNAEFKLENVSLSDVKGYMTYGEYSEYDMDEDVYVVENLEEAYMNGEDIPNIILDKNLNIIDDSHRASMYENLGIGYFKAYVMQ